MGMNVGYLTSQSNRESDETYTPFYAVEPIIKYLKEGSTIWCPFDKEWSAYVVLLKEKGFNVIHTHIDDGGDFFNTKVECDYIISNPPYSIKDDVIRRLYHLDNPFAMLMPIQTLQGRERYKSFKNGLEILVFDQRVGFHTNQSFEQSSESNHFASIYFCRNVLPEKLMFESLNKYQRSLDGDAIVRTKQQTIFDIIGEEDDKND